MDLRIIIVTYNNRSTIGRCLSSLPDACAGMDWEAVIVDNASSDGTADEIRNCTLIKNRENRGFAAACNQALGGLDARYALLLNPDARCPAGSLTALVREADARSRAGIIGPKLLNEDGTTQTSVRRFPGFWDQVGIALKLHNLFPSLPAFRRYFAQDVDLDREHVVDQVMGACFLIRREVIDAIGGLDERYFVWFEEVDYCLMAKEAGWDTVYVPTVSVTHAGGHSFAQMFSTTKQRMFNASLIAYADKWWGSRSAAVFRLLNPISLALAWTVGRLGMTGRGGRSVLRSQNDKPQTTNDKPSTRSWLIAIAILELVSALTIFHDVANSIALIIATGIVAIISWKRPSLGLALLALELVIGSKGALLQLGGWPGTSLRICLFVAFFIGWAGNLLDGRRIVKLIALMRTRWEWILVFIAVAYGVARGLALHQPFLLADANAWGFTLLILPVIDVAAHDGARLRRYASAAIIAGLLWLGMKTLVLEYIFSHGFVSIASNVYLWVRRTGVAEVTLITVNAFRIFMQSYIYAMVGLLGAMGWVVESYNREVVESPKKASRLHDFTTSRLASFLLIASAVSLAISLSRSIWMGTMAGLIVLVVLMRKLISRSAVIRIIRDGVIAMALVALVIVFPIPHVDIGSLKTLFGSRLSVTDDAAATRWNLVPVVTSKIREHIILGSGFGATITYQSKDPRIVSQGKGGIITTYAFEWGWLEHWVKMGILGVIAVLLLVVGVGRRAWRSENDVWVRCASIAILIGLAVTHFFTPYLNHPLGFGILMMIEGLSVAQFSSGSVSRDVIFG